MDSLAYWYFECNFYTVINFGLTYDWFASFHGLVSE